jgi:hypothetical protein
MNKKLILKVADEIEAMPLAEMNDDGSLAILMDALLNATTEWLAAHPRITTALVCIMILAAFRIEGL